MLNGIDFSLFYKESSNYKNHHPKRVGILYRTGEHKGMKDGLKAFLIAKKKHINIQLVLFGQEPNIDDIKIIEKIKSVEFHKLPYKEKLRKIYNSLDIFIFPSHFEGFGNPPMEAMACGVVCVTTNVGGIPDYTISGETALVSRPKDIKVFAQNMIRLLVNGDERRKIAIVHPRLGWGGSEARALWAVEALKADYNVSLITSGRVDIPRLNKYYGTDLDPKEFSILQVPLPLGLRNTIKFAAIRGRVVQRYCQHLASNFDLMISAYNLCDFKVRGAQFIADFSFDEELRRDLNLIAKDWGKWYHSNNFLRKIYLKFCNLISPFNSEAWRNDFIVANSNWTAELMREKYGVEACVIYPPVTVNFPIIPYEKRENGFVCIGRIVPEKRIDTIIEILEKVRQKGHDVHLHVIGGTVDNRYGQNLEELSQKHREWVFLEGWLGGQKKNEIIVNHRFGISGCKNESFGIAVAEMVKAGCIVFVPNGGGQVEIVDHPKLIYENIEDGVQKIEIVLKNERLQNNLREHLSLVSQKFSVENFQKSIREIVSNFFKGKICLK